MDYTWAKPNTCKALWQNIYVEHLLDSWFRILTPHVIPHCANPRPGKGYPVPLDVLSYMTGSVIQGPDLVRPTSIAIISSRAPAAAHGTSTLPSHF